MMTEHRDPALAALFEQGGLTSLWGDVPSCIRAGGLMSRWGDVPSCVRAGGLISRWGDVPPAFVQAA